MEYHADHVDPFNLLVVVFQQADFLSSRSKSERRAAPRAYGNLYDLSEEHVVYT
jgi:hypothetical protein